MNYRSRLIAIAVLGAAPAALIAQNGAGVHYPESHKSTYTETLHGQEMADPYRWLEDDVRTSEEVADWVEAQNAVTFGYLEGLEDRSLIEQEITDLWDYERFSAPFRVGDRYFFSRNDGLQNQSVLYVQEGLEDEGRVLFDPNTWSEDGTVALAGLSISDDAKYAAYGVASAGSDWREWRIRDIDTGEDLDDRIQWVKFSGVSWTPDNTGFFYSRYPETEEGSEFQSLNYNQKVFYHALGTDQSEDVLVYERPDEPTWGFGAQVTEAGDYVVVSTWKGTDNKNLVHYKPLASPGAEFVELIGEFANDYSLVGNDGSVFYFRTDESAKNGRVIAIDTENPAKSEWREIIPESDEALRGVGFVNDMFVASYLKDAVTAVKIYTPAGGFVRDVKFPTLGSAGGFNGRRDHTETFYTFSSFAVPPSIYRYDMQTGRSTLMRQAEVAFDPDQYETRQVFYTSKDGTRVPMFISHKKGLKLDGTNATMLYGYGGFNIPITPSFSVVNLMWMKMGGVYAVANLRGGGEYGKRWHDAGRLYNKQNVFDDFISAGEYLIAEGYTSPDKLAIRGGSNGGLLVGACMAQRPDLFGVALPAVGVMDMLRFHKFTAGRFWVDDYGSPDDPEMFEYLKGYSPYHNLHDGTEYPATLVTTADTDDRVVPGHSFKFAARLQEAHTGDNPVMIRIETRAGHGAGKPVSKRIEEAADILAFTAENLDMDIQLTRP